MISSSSLLDKYLGCFYGLAIGDAYGAPYEGGILERLFWKFISKTKEGKIRYTDDTQMSLDLANSLIQNEGINQDKLANSFAKGYQYSRGYGPGAAKLLKKIRNGGKWQALNKAQFKEGSFGNGAAMRSPILSLFFFHNLNELKNNTVLASEITHAHPLAIEGAQLISFVCYAALHDWSMRDILKVLPTWCKSKAYKEKVFFCIEYLNEDNSFSNKDIINNLGNSISASQSCLTSIYFALRYKDKDYNLMLEHIYKLGGDTDTIGAMAGAIWGSFNGYKNIDQNKICNIEDSEEIFELATALYKLRHKA